MHPARPARLSWLTSAATLLVGSVLLLTLTGAQAQWKWRDKNGQIHASDLPPPRDVADKDVIQRPNAPVRAVAAPASAASGADAATARPPQAETELDKRRKSAEQEQAAKARGEEERLAAQRRDNCARARAHATALEGGQRIARVNEKGEREVLDDRGRADELRRAREVITSDCR